MRPANIISLLITKLSNWVALKHAVSLERIVFSTENMNLIKGFLAREAGMVVVCSPDGHGKTTTKLSLKAFSKKRDCLMDIDDAESFKQAAKKAKDIYVFTSIEAKDAADALRKLVLLGVTTDISLLIIAQRLVNAGQNRVAIHELLELNSEIIDAAKSDKLSDFLSKNKFKSFNDDGLLKVKGGAISAEELYKVIDSKSGM